MADRARMHLGVGVHARPQAPSGVSSSRAHPRPGAPPERKPKPWRRRARRRAHRPRRAPPADGKATTVPMTNTTMSRRSDPGPAEELVARRWRGSMPRSRPATPTGRAGRWRWPAHAAAGARSATTTRGTSEPLVTRYTLDSTSMMKASGNSKQAAEALRQHQAQAGPQHATTPPPWPGGPRGCGR